MNDDTDKPLNTVGDDALEARITAWVLGEASSFEAGELEKLCAADPALRLFERRLRVLHGLVAEDFKAGGDAEWRLSTERLVKITDLLGVAPEVEEKIAARREKSRGPSVRGILLALAACVVLGFISISLIGGVGESAKNAGLKENFRLEAFSLRQSQSMESGTLRQVERGTRAPVKKPESSYAHLAQNSAFTSKPPPPAMRAGQEARPTATSGLALDGVDRNNSPAGAGGPPPSAAPEAASAPDAQALALNERQSGQKATESAAKLSDHVIGYTDGVAGGGVPAEKAAPLVSRSNVDFIPPVEGVTIPGIPAAADLVTGGLRSGDAVITRNNIDAILNNPIRSASAKGEGIAALTVNGALAQGEKKMADKSDAGQSARGDGNAAGAMVESATRSPQPGADDVAGISNLTRKEQELGESTLPADAAARGFLNFKQERPVAEGGRGLADRDAFGRSAPDPVLSPPVPAQPPAAPVPAVADEFRGLADPGAPISRETADEGTKARFRKDSGIAGGAVGGGLKRDVGGELDAAPTDAEDEVQARILEEVDKAWELPVPPVDAPAVTDPVVLDESSEKAKVPEVALQAALDLMSEVVAADEPFSTFSLHVSDASFKLAQAAMERGEVPAAESIRPEEFYNAFDYGDPAPASGEPVVCVTEQSAHPAFAQRNLLRIGVRTGSQGRGASTPLNLTLLLDHSGSMEREDRNAGLAMAVRQLSGLLKEGDTITVAGFSRQPRLLADRLPGARAQELNELIARTPSEGGTNLEEGLKLGEELAKRQFNPAAQNRVVLFTDGAANLGDARPEALQARVEALRQQGIAFDAAGFGAAGLNDKLLERLTRNGNGRYYIVDGPEDADAGFAKQLAGAFRPAAENVKVQLRFNPARVAKYKLIGFEEHRLNKEDFRNDAVDAAEMAAEEAGNALYQIETLPQGEGEVGEVSVRFRDVASGQMVERTWTIPYDAQAPAFDQATPSIQLGGLAAFTAEKLRAAPMADAVDFQQLGQVFAGVRARYPNSRPVADLGSMLGKLK
jgi:secreted protein with Ig-like and vWFA domain